MTDETIIPGISPEAIEMYQKNQEWKERQEQKSFFGRIISRFLK